MEDLSEIDIENTETQVPETSAASPEKVKLVRLPLARIKHMMKMDPDCGLISQEALILVTKSTELFIEFLSREAIKVMSTSKRKTVQKKDVDAVIDGQANLCFLDGAME